MNSRVSRDIFPEGSPRCSSSSAKWRPGPSGTVRGVLGAAVAPMLVLMSAAHAQSGIWKAYVPEPGSVQGEFNSTDPVGLASGAEIHADCSLRWVDPKTQKTYCFASGTSLQTFLDAPERFIRAAEAGWLKLHPSG
jgi:hypothetical protein